LIEVHSGEENSPNDIRQSGADTKELTFRGDQFTSQHLEKLKQFSGVWSLTLLDCTKITGDALEHLPTNLENLEQRGCDEIKDSDLDKLPRTLQSLTLPFPRPLLDRYLDFGTTVTQTIVTARKTCLQKGVMLLKKADEASPSQKRRARMS
jgi:hypothetical protein